MKKYQCLVCGFDINESDVKCSNCNSIIDMDIITSKDPIKTIKHTIKINCLNSEYKKNISLLEKTDNELLLEYYKMFSYKMLNKTYNEDNFFTSDFKYQDEELDEVISHILEHNFIYNNSNIELIINKSKHKNKYLDILNSINSDEYQKPKENDLRTLLFNEVKIPQTKEYNATFEEGKSYITLSIILYIIFIAVVLLFVPSDLRNQVMNLALIVPGITLSKALSKIIYKKKTPINTFIIFILILYVTTLLYYIISNGFSGNMFVDHIKSLINTPSDFIKILIERAGDNNAI